MDLGKQHQRMDAQAMSEDSESDEENSLDEETSLDEGTSDDTESDEETPLDELILEALGAELDFCDAVRHQEEKAARFKYQTLPEVTISAEAEIGLAMELPIHVPKQRTFTDKKPVIPSSLANTSCASMGSDQLLSQLNRVLGTSYTLDTPSLYYLLEGCISNNYDFGIAYSRLRTVWYSIIQDDFIQEIWEVKDQRMRAEVLADGRILEPSMPPRRVWDLYSNRVVPYWWMTSSSEELWAISHAWANVEDRVNVLTPINGNEWPVPIPKDANLMLIRIEMLNLGAEYAWLDVLCLRQKDGRREDLRNKEWELDIPTIGHVYRDARRVVCYFSGLGRPLNLEESSWESDRCWFRRAWTLQEVSENWIIGGDTTGDEGNAQANTLASLKFHEQLASLENVTHDLSDVFDMLVHMRNRVSENPVDKIAGLAFPLRPKTIPAYYAMQSDEDAWTALVNVMLTCFRGDLFFRYPEPGKGRKKWRPSWKQVMHEDIEMLQLKVSGEHVFQSIIRYPKWDRDCYSGQGIKNVCVLGLAAEEPEGKLRRGELIIKDGTGTRHKFEIVADHKHSIPEGLYALLSSELPWEHWVAGYIRAEGFEKVSVFRMTDRGEGERLERLGVTENISAMVLL